LSKELHGFGHQRGGGIGDAHRRAVGGEPEPRRRRALPLIVSARQLPVEGSTAVVLGMEISGCEPVFNIEVNGVHCDRD
jgi:hypothetical protein